MRFSELRVKEVINIKDCKRLGCVSDLEFDACSGCIMKIFVPGPGKLGGLFGCKSEYVISFKQIKQIGPDVILVDICEETALVEIDKKQGFF